MRKIPRELVIEKAIQGHAAIGSLPQDYFRVGSETVRQDISIACHTATLYWLLCASRESYMNANTFSNTIGNEITSIVSKIMQYALGQQSLLPLAKGQKLSFGSIIIFEKDNEPLHSCVAVTKSKIAGYN